MNDKHCSKHPVRSTICPDCLSLVPTWFEEYGGLVIVGVIALLILAGMRVLWAEFIYHDWRCFAAECRIQVDPRN